MSADIDEIDFIRIDKRKHNSILDPMQVKLSEDPALAVLNVTLSDPNNGLAVPDEPQLEKERTGTAQEVTLIADQLTVIG